MLRTLSFRLKQWRRDDVGAAAVELALIAPVALIMLSVGVAGGQALETYHKVVVTAHTITDLVSRTPYSPDSTTTTAEDLSAAQLQTDMAMSQMTMYPYSATPLQAVMSELFVNASTNQGTVIWSNAYNGATALKPGTQIALSPAYVASGATYLLYGQVSYTYQPFDGILSLPSMTLSATETLTIRNAPQIILN
jgi:Flp pilus assembly protein TadG